jgi:hypothetical protein
MNNSLKGACLSGLVYPGLGQIIQKHYTRGIVLISIVSTCLIVILINAIRIINTILVDVGSNNTGMDVTTIMKEVHTLSAGQDYLIMKYATTLIFFCWVVGIVDSYLSGKKTDS